MVGFRIIWLHLDRPLRCFDATLESSILVVLTAERRLTVRSYHPGPYVSAEAFYEGPYSKWAVTRLYAGCLLPLSKHLELDPYYQHENNSEPRPIQQKNGAELILWLCFLRDKRRERKLVNNDCRITAAHQIRLNGVTGPPAFFGPSIVLRSHHYQANGSL